MNEFRNDFGRDIFYHKYAQTQDQSWAEKAYALVEDVVGTRWGKAPPLMSKSDRKDLQELITKFRFLPGGRYIYYAGREANFFNNCYLLRGEEDTREEWARLTRDAVSCLMTGGGIGIDYSVFRHEGALLQRTGGRASGPIPLMKMINENGRNVMQGGSRRSAIYASLNWQHEDADKFIYAKDWRNMEINPDITVWDAKQSDFNYPAPLDMTNMSLNYDDAWLEQIRKGEMPRTYMLNMLMALISGEPGFSFNFGSKSNETLRNACTEVTSEDDSDVCNLGSINMAACDTIEQFEEACILGSKFLVAGTLRADLPYQKVEEVRNRNRRLGLGIMGVHEWLLKRGYKYEMNDELRDWLNVYEDASEAAANEHCNRFFLSKPKGYRAIAPTGSIGILAGTTTGIEPLFAVAYKRRYLGSGNVWKYQYVVDSTAKQIIEELGTDPSGIENALDLAADPERRIAFQADVQDHVDMGISSTINLPAWGTELNNTVEPMARMLAKYAHRLRGFTCYPDGARGGQPLTSVPYDEAVGQEGVEFNEHDICDISGKGGSCGG